MYTQNCEFIENGLCFGCTRSPAEEDWIGKYKCAIYKKIKEEKKANDNQITFAMQK